MLKNIIAIFCSGIILVSCATPKIEVEHKPAERSQLNLPLPTAITLDNVTWVVITEENIDEIIEQLKDNKGEVVVFAITPDGYEKLSLNNQKILIYIKQLQDQLQAYKEYYENGEK